MSITRIVLMLKPQARPTCARRIHSVVSALAVLLLAACGGDSTAPPPPPTALAFVTAPAGSTAALAPLSPAPVIELRDAQNHPVKQAGVQVSASLDGGTVSGTTAVATDASGRATFGSLSLSAPAGSHQLRFSSTGLTTLTRAITLTAGTASRITARSSVNQSATVGQAVSDPPAVLVSDNAGNPIPGVTVTFAVTAGGGTLQGPSPVSDGAGVARVTSWTVGATPGANTVTATLAGASPVTFNATAGAPASPYAIQTQLIGSPTAAEEAAVAAAVQRWQDIIAGDLPNHVINIPAGTCFPGQPAVSATIDDIRIQVVIDSIDGPGDVLGGAGPCVLRSASGLPSLGFIKLDSADLAAMTQDDLNNLLLHEMGHVLGFGTLWPDQGLLTGACPDDEDATVCNSDPQFVGAVGRQWYHDLGGSSTNVPVEATGGVGTWNSHWRESVFHNELMTGFIGGGANPITAVTIGSMQDLGYVVDFTSAEPLGFTLAGLRRLPAPARKLVERAPSGSILITDIDGRIVGQRPRR
jgi:hypothetical protein